MKVVQVRTKLKYKDCAMRACIGLWKVYRPSNAGLRMERKEKEYQRAWRWVSIMRRMRKGACGDKSEGKSVMYKSKEMMKGRTLRLHKD